MGNRPEIIFIMKLEPDLDPEPEKLSEHGAICLKSKNHILLLLL